MPARVPPRRGPARMAVWGIVVATLLAGCSVGSDASFDPTGPCTTDGQRAGAYPELEARLPGTFEGRPPDKVDSGRSCTSDNLGTLARHGIDELRFAGATWETGRESGLTLALFEADGLSVDRLAEFYEAGARSARRTENIETGPFEILGTSGRRLDALVEDAFQSIVVLPGDGPDSVRAVLVATDLGEAESRAAHDALVMRAATTALGDGADATRPSRGNRPHDWAFAAGHGTLGA